MYVFVLAVLCFLYHTRYVLLVLSKISSVGAKGTSFIFVLSSFFAFCAKAQMNIFVLSSFACCAKCTSLSFHPLLYVLTTNGHLCPIVYLLSVSYVLFSVSTKVR